MASLISFKDLEESLHMELMRYEVEFSTGAQESFHFLISSESELGSLTFVC